MRVANREEGKRVSLKAADEIIADFNRVFIWAGCGKLKESPFKCHFTLSFSP